MTSLHPTPNRAFGWRDVLLVGGGLAFVAVLQFSPSDGPERIDYTSEIIVEYFGPAPNSEHSDALESYQELVASGGYFGSFAHAPDGAYGWSDNYSDPALADAIALANCAEYSESCSIILRLAPAEEKMFEGQVLSHTQGTGLNAYQNYPTQKAFAMTREGSWGSAWNHAFPASAQRAAMELCEQTIENKKHPEVCRLVQVN